MLLAAAVRFGGLAEQRGVTSSILAKCPPDRAENAEVPLVGEHGLKVEHNFGDAASKYTGKHAGKARVLEGRSKRLPEPGAVSLPAATCSKAARGRANSQAFCGNTLLYPKA